ncbi:hypothetical protein E4T43_09144 [Aureobasidium subglaciale]|nr:hypothetical protein E4T43_09144 [Aureobasidium subglaciale]
MCRRDADAMGANLDIAKGREVLPKNVKPLHYHLTLEPNLETFEYEGKVVIELDVVDDTTSISLNTIDLNIKSTEVHSGSKLIASSPKLTYDENTQTTTVSFPDTIPAGHKATLTQTFTGTLNANMAGFYRSSYKGEDGSDKYIATTQMEPTDARRAFPCFDEPALKAEFTITLIADKKLTCLSNMDVANEKDVHNGKKAVTFNKSPLMSTYLLAFIVGELNMIETDAFRLPVRVFATPDKDIEHGRFSLELAAKTLDFYETKFNSKFPLPKMDMVAIPDFSAGAMENWGLITYRVVDLLFDEKTSGASTKQRVAEVVQHELAHQWFGNLVTMDFWDGLWLNEGFATWMSWYSCNEFYPEWKVWQGYVTDNLQSALALDSLRSSHPIEVPVKRADEINQIFDAISYSKGSCVLRMVSKYLGEETFMEGVRRYLKKHAFGNTQTNDLWAALSDASGKDVEKIMDIWTKNVGFPVVSVTEDAKNNSVHVKQNRFLRTADVKPEEDKILYPVFLGLRSKDGVDEELTLDGRERSFKVKDLDFYKINADHSGIYRTSYSPERLQKLGEAAKKGLLTVEDRAGMIADAGALAASGYQKTSGVLSLLQGFDTEPEFVVWDELTARIASVRAAWVFQDNKVKDALKAFQRDLVSKKSHELGWDFKESDGHIEQQFKSLLFSSAALAGDEKTKTAALEMFENFKNGDRSAIHPNLRAGVYAIVLQNGGEAEYDAILNEYRTAKIADERNTALRSIGRARQPELIKRTLAMALSKEVKDQDIYLPLGGLRSHKEGILALWSWVKENWDTIYKKLPPGLSMLGSVVSLCTSSFTSEKQIQEIDAFFKERSTKGFDQSLAQSFDAIRAKEGWLKRDAEDVEAWLKANKYLMPTAGDERERSPHPYARRGRRAARSAESSSYDATQTPTNLSSESGTEADDERPPQYLKALPPPCTRPAKGLRQAGDDATDESPSPLLTPSQLDNQGRHLSEGYFDHKPSQAILEQAGEDELLIARRLFIKRTRAERIRRISEGALLAVIGLIIILAPSVTHALWNWHRAELISQLAVIALLIAVYPLRVVIFRPSNDTTRPRWRRFRVPASFDPASILYPTFVPVLIALSLLPQYPALLLPNLIIGLASLPPRLFPPLSRLNGINTFHWIVSITPLIFSENTELPSMTFPPSPYKLKASQPPFLKPELLTLLYPLHQALLPPLHYLTTTSLLAAEKHLLSAGLINLLLFATSPQTVILRALLWIGGVWLLILCTHVVRWNVALARVPRWRFRKIRSKSGHSFLANNNLFSRIAKWVYPMTQYQNDDSDADGNVPVHRVQSQTPERPKLNVDTTPTCSDVHEPKSAMEANLESHRDSVVDANDFSRKRRHTIASMDNPAPMFTKIPSAAAQRRQRRLRDWHLNLTLEGAYMYKWAYAIYIFTTIAFVILVPVRNKISEAALGSAEPIIWAFEYLFSDISTFIAAFSSRVDRIAYKDEILQNLSLHGSSVPGLRAAVGAANTRLLIVAYWAAVLCVGLVAVLRLTPFIEVDTRRKVFHAVMVTMLLPSIFVDPCFCQVPPLGIAIGRFVAPYVDGRDLRGPMVVSHVFLLIGCAIPLWLSLAGIGRTKTGRWPGWETENETREVAMVAGVICVGMGDAAASLIGRRFGRCKWPWIGGKSLEGSGAFAVAVTIGLLFAKSWVRFGGWPEVYSRESFLPLHLDLGFWSVEIIKMFICGCGASVMEAVLTGANDNVVVPVALWLLVKSLGV